MAVRGASPGTAPTVVVHPLEAGSEQDHLQLPVLHPPTAGAGDDPLLLGIAWQELVSAPGGQQ